MNRAINKQNQNPPGIVTSSSFESPAILGYQILGFLAQDAVGIQKVLRSPGLCGTQKMNLKSPKLIIKTFGESSKLGNLTMATFFLLPLLKLSSSLTENNLRFGSKRTFPFIFK